MESTVSVFGTKTIQGQSRTAINTKIQIIFIKKEEARKEIYRKFTLET